MSINKDFCDYLSWVVYCMNLESCTWLRLHPENVNLFQVHRYLTKNRNVLICNTDQFLLHNIFTRCVEYAGWDNSPKKWSWFQKLIHPIILHFSHNLCFCWRIGFIVEFRWTSFSEHVILDVNVCWPKRNLFGNTL